jgi:hypothetical protein
MKPSTLLLVTGLTATTLLSACHDSEDAPPAPPETVAAGRFALTSHVTLPASALLPPAADEALGILDGLHDAPGETLVRVLDDAGVPIVGTVFDRLPGALRDRVTGWMDDYLRSTVFRDASVMSHLDAIASAAHATIGGFDLDSDLVVDADAPAATQHTLRTLRFQIDDQSFAFDVPATELTSATCAATSQVGGTLAVDAHGFGLAYGEYADRALDASLVARYGTDLRGTLDQLIDCDALAASVANRCVLGVCVGHESDLVELCASGLDEVASQVHAELRSLRFDALRFERGQAQLVDAAPADGLAEALDGGVWQARIDLGQGLRDVGATFTGRADQ